MLEPFLFCSCIVIKLVVFSLSEDARWLHGSPSLRTKYALDLNASVHLKKLAIIAYPILIRHFIDPIALLMYWNIAYLTEDYLVLVFVVAVVADGAQLVLHDQTPLSCRQRVEAIDLLPFG